MIHRNRLMPTLCLLLALAATRAGAASVAPEWPQWRGPTRDGVAVSSPKLMDEWPKEGPPLLWKSGAIPSTSADTGGKLANEGGSGSPVVSGGKVFVFVHWKHQVGKLLIPTPMLKGLGWEEGVPDDLARKIDDARMSDKRKNVSGAALDAYIQEFVSGVDPEQATKFGDHIKFRLTQGRDALSWKDFSHLVKGRDKEFASFAELLNGVDHCHNGAHGNPGNPALSSFFWTPFLAKTYRYADTVICLDSAKGNEIWKKEFPGILPEPELGWLSSTTPAVAGDRMYVAGSAALYCLSVKDGALVWQCKADLGYSSPLVADGRVYIYEGDTQPGNNYNWRAAQALTALSAEDGKVLWRQPKVGHTDGSVVLWKNGGTNYLISGAPGGPWCLDPATGNVLWEPPAGAPRVNGAWENHGTPAIHGDVVVCYSSPMTAYRMTPQNAAFLWKVNGGSRGASPLIYHEHAYFFGGQGHATCVDLKTGQVKWDKLGVTGEVASPIAADGKIIYSPVAGPNIGMFKASPQKFEELGRFPANISNCSSPAIADGRLYVRMNDHIACYDLLEHRPYLGGMTGKKDELVFSFNQAEGGLVATNSSDGALRGVTIKDAKGVEKPAKATIRGSDIVVNIKDEITPIEIRSAWSNGVTTKAGLPVPDLKWKSLALSCKQVSSNVLTLAFTKAGDPKVWQTDKAYAVAGMKIANVDLANDGLTVRLTLDNPLTIGQQVSIKYPWLATDQVSGPLAETAFTALPGRPVDGGLLQEFLFGGAKPNIDETKILNENILEKDIKPSAGDKWHRGESILQASTGERGAFNVAEFAGVGGWHNLGHACVYVYSDADRNVQLWAGSIDRIKIMVNGRNVYTNQNPTNQDPWAADTDKVKDVQLVKGWNTIITAIAQGGGWWSFNLRIRDENGNAPTGLSYTADKPEI